MTVNERVVNLLKNSNVFYFATVDGDKPNVRPYNAVMLYEDEVYFYTNNHKSAFKQMNENPNVEICAMIGEDRWLRVSGTAVFDDSIEVKKAMIEENPHLKKSYREDDKIFEVFYLEDMQASIHSTYEATEKLV